VHTLDYYYYLFRVVVVENTNPPRAATLIVFIVVSDLLQCQFTPSFTAVSLCQICFNSIVLIIDCSYFGFFATFTCPKIFHTSTAGPLTAGNRAEIPEKQRTLRANRFPAKERIFRRNVIMVYHDGGSSNHALTRMPTLGVRSTGFCAL
jgi:hypothetical protein